MADYPSVSPTKTAKRGMVIIGVLSGICFGLYTYAVAKGVQAKTIEGVNDILFLRAQGIGVPEE